MPYNDLEVLFPTTIPLLILQAVLWVIFFQFPQKTPSRIEVLGRKDAYFMLGIWLFTCAIPFIAGADALAARIQAHIPVMHILINGIIYATCVFVGCAIVFCFVSHFAVKLIKKIPSNMQTIADKTSIILSSLFCSCALYLSGWHWAWDYLTKK